MGWVGCDRLAEIPKGAVVFHFAVVRATEVLEQLDLVGRAAVRPRESAGTARDHLGVRERVRGRVSTRVEPDVRELLVRLGKAWIGGDRLHDANSVGLDALIENDC